MRYSNPNEKNRMRKTKAENSSPAADDVVSANSLHEEPRTNYNSMNHTAQLIRAAMPHVGHRSQRSMSAVLQVTELMDTVQSLQSNDDVSAMGLEDENINLEAMLLDMREVCSGQEKDLLDNMLNFVKARNIYSTYRSMSASNPGSKQASAASIGKMLGLDENANMMDVLTSFLTPEQKATFDNLSMIMSVMS